MKKSTKLTIDYIKYYFKRHSLDIVKLLLLPIFLIVFKIIYPNLRIVIESDIYLISAIVILIMMILFVLTIIVQSIFNFNMRMRCKYDDEEYVEKSDQWE